MCEKINSKNSYKSPKESFLSLSNKRKTFPGEGAKKYSYNKKVKIDKYMYNNNHSPVIPNKFKKYLNINSIPNNQIENNKINKNKLIKSQKKPLMLLDPFSINNYKNFNNSNSNIKNHLISNTETNLNTLIKVNIKLNKEKEKEYTQINNVIKKGNISKTKKYEEKTKKNIITNEQDENNEKSQIKKISIIYKQNKINMMNKIIEFFFKIKIFIYKNIMKNFKICLYNINYYFLKWHKIVYSKKIINMIINCKKKYYIKVPINKRKNIIENKIKKKNLTDKKKKKIIYKNCFNNCNIYNSNKKINPNILGDSKSINNIIDSYSTINTDGYHYSVLQQKMPIKSFFSTKLSTILNNHQYNLEENSNNTNNKLYSSITNNNRIISKYINLNLGKLNNNIISPINRLKYKNIINNNINNSNNFKKEKINKVKKLNFNKNNSNKNRTQKNKLKDIKYINTISNIYNKQTNMNLNNYINKTIDDYKNRNYDNNTFHQRNDFYINDFENYDHSKKYNEKTLNTEISDNYNFIKSDFYDNNFLTINAKKKENKNKIPKMKKLETCQYTLNNMKYNIYKKYYVKKYLDKWNKIIFKNKILNNFIQQSCKVKLSCLFYNKIKQMILFTFQKIVLKKYFDKYKDINIRKYILKKLKLQFYNINSNIKKNLINIYDKNGKSLEQKGGDIINNININNFINCTNDDIKNIISLPKFNRYNIVSNSLKIKDNFSFNNIKSGLSYIKEYDKINLLNGDSNFIMEKKSIPNKNIQNKPKGNLIDQVNQFRMVFNLLEQHNNRKPSLFNCFKKWEKYCFEKKIYKKTTFDYNKDKKNEINEKIINFKKINIYNKYNENTYVENNNKNILKALDNNIIKRNDIYEVNSLNNINTNKNERKYIQLKVKKVYITRHSNTMRGVENNNKDDIPIDKNNENIKYIDYLHKNIIDNKYNEESKTKNRLNNEIIYQKKILNYNNILNINSYNSCYKNDNLIPNNYAYNKVNKIEEREVHFNSLSTKKQNNSYKKIKNNNNILYNDNFNIFDNNISPETRITKFSESQLEKEILKVKIDLKEINDNKNLYNKDSNNININKEEIKTNINFSELFHKIKNSFLKIKKDENKKVNQTFCCVLVNLQDEFD